jgi:endonuclease YncB( thermonuclease family)
MSKRVWLWGVASLLAAAGAAQASSIPDCAGPVEIESVRILRVERTNDVLVLRDGRAIHMEGIVLPRGAKDHAPSAIADQAFDAVNKFVKTRELTVTAVAPKEDRYDRVRGQIFNGDNAEPWLQHLLVSRGLARVDIAPDRGECAEELYAAEAQARAAHLGLWSVPAYQVRTPEGLGGDTGTFQVVEGQVLSADVKDGRAYLDFGPDYRTDFTITVAPADMANFRAAGVDPRDYQGKRIRVRGFIQQHNGPEIEIANPKQIELVQ